MAEAKAITKLIVDNSSYKKGLSESEKELRKWTSSNMSADKQLAGLIKTAGKFAAGIMAGDAAIKLFEKAMNGAQTTADAFANTTYAMKTSVDNFFTSLVSGNWTNFQRGIGDMINRAYEASAAMDQLWNTMQSFGVASALYGNEFSEAMVDIRDTSLTKEQRQAAADRAQAAVDKQKEAASVAYGDSYKYAKVKVAEVSGLNVSNITDDDILAAALADATKNRDAVKRKGSAAAAKFSKLLTAATVENQETRFTGMGYTTTTNRAKAYNQAVSQMKPEEIKSIVANAYLELMSDEELQGVNQQIVAGYQAKTSATSMERSLVRAKNSINKPIKAGSSSSGLSGGKSGVTSAVPEIEMAAFKELDLVQPWQHSRQSVKDLEVEIQNLQDLQRSDDPGNWKTWQRQIDKANEKIEATKQGMIDLNGNTLDFSGATIADIKTDIPASGLTQFNTGTKKVTKSSDELLATWSQIGNMISSAGSAMQAVGDKGFNIAGTVAQAIANILLSYTMAATQAAALGPVAWAAFAVSGLSTAIATVASIKQAASYAEGGIVPGGDYRDGITARVSSGEMILNQADARKLYGEIHSGNFGGGGVQGVVIRGENIYTALNNYGKRTGRGEMVFSK